MHTMKGRFNKGNKQRQESYLCKVEVDSSSVEQSPACRKCESAPEGDNVGFLEDLGFVCAFILQQSWGQAEEPTSPAPTPPGS